MTQAIEEAVNKVLDGYCPVIREHSPSATPLTEILTTLYSQGRDAGVEECAKIVNKYLVRRNGTVVLDFLEGITVYERNTTLMAIESELLKLKGTA